MKKIISALLTLSFAAALSAQVKNYVGIVREKYYPAHEEFLKELASSLKGRGYASYAEYVDAYLKGGFGSGFVYVDKDGTNYVITNRHVVSQAASASIEFENENGSTTKYENLSVVITDDDIDLAVLKFEANAKPFKSGLTLSSAKVSDGQNVCSAGFPGLGNDPVWQFGKGSVTNATARIKDLIDPSISTVIQHSAQIDAGNSGGPLLIESKAAPTGYEVVGINTWKAAGRDSTNFSIPAKLALDLIEKAKKAADENAVKADRAAKFKAALTDSANDYTSIVKFISYDYAAANGEDEFDEILRHGSTKIRNRVAAEFAFDPIEGLRYAVAYNLYNNYSGENATEENLSKVVWAKEHGLFRISSINEGKKEKKSASKTSSKSASDVKSTSKKSSKKKKKGTFDVSFEGIDNPYYVGIAGGMLFPIGKSEENIDLANSFNIAVEVFPNEFGIFGGVFEYQHTKFGTEDMNLFGAGAAIRVPLSFNFFTLCPTAQAGMKVGFGNIKDFQVFAELGLTTTFNFGIDYFRPGFELGVRGLSDKCTSSDLRGTDFTLKSADFVAKLLIAFTFD
ncbi:S1C family serine protease [Treponema sp. C6A8]|uniref:S1C family serine protease n=1 Tax=Treponema sp. C6A8 TaxID=1410609 RepID=UPI0004862692|nr:serine protease [Treponema sp. C6A8]